MTPFIAFRHLRTRLRSTLLTALGVALSVTVMCTMASMLLGSQQQFVDNIVENTPNVTVEETRVGEETRAPALPAPSEEFVVLSRRPPPPRRRGIVNYQEFVGRITRIPGVVAAAPSLTGQAILRYGTRGRPVQLTGILPREQARAVTWTSGLSQQRDALDATTNGAVIGRELATNLGIPPGARVTLITGPNRQQRVRVIAFYSAGVRSIDETVVYVNLSLAQSLLDRPSQANSIAVRLADFEQAPTIAGRVQTVTGFRARSWQEINEAFFSVFRLQNSLTTLMISFIIIISGFGITNGLITVILEKQRDIGILKAMGTPSDRIVAIFLLEGIVMGVLGAVAGIALSSLAIQYIDQIPLRGEGELTTSNTFTMLRVPGVYLIPAMIAVATSILASLLPVRRAAAYDPVAIIRSAK